ncbi:LON peptidase N-terminal domain and RING finger protein 1 [Nymphon striatum]|nr:LON peptidase N-terminal domain and RING finger protein 1 [Nymphon striatum]
MFATASAHDELVSDSLRQIEHSNQDNFVSRNIRQALDDYERACELGMNLSRHHFDGIVSSVCNFFDSSQNCSSDLDPTHCPYCRFVIVNPVTLPCGHSLCSWCTTERVCPKCSQTFEHIPLDDLKVNITLKNVCQKWWGDQIIRAKKRTEAFGLFEDFESLSADISERMAAELKILDQSDCDEIDPSRISYLSKLKCLNGETAEAKRLAKSCINLVPDWHIGYLRLAEATESELLIDDTIIHYFQAYIRSPIEKLKKSIKETIINLKRGISPLFEESVDHITIVDHITDSVILSNGIASTVLNQKAFKLLSTNISLEQQQIRKGTDGALQIIMSYKFNSIESFGALPDGIGSDFVLEIKCSTSQNSLKQYLEKKNKLTKKCRAQIMLQLLLTENQQVLFCDEEDEEIDIHVVPFDRNLTNELICKVENFGKILEICYTVQDNSNTQHSSSSSSPSSPNGSKFTLLKNHAKPSNISDYQQRKILSGCMNKLFSLVDKVLVAGEAVLSEYSKATQPYRVVNPEKVEIADFDCSLCCRMLYDPVTTPCGHTFCMSCLNRSLDHTTNCPLCKQNIEKMVECDKRVTEFFEVILKRYFHSQYQEREFNYKEELKSFKQGIETGSRVPVFVCTVALPAHPCPLHVFEPRYKLLLRLCLNSKSNLFGMCTSSNNEAGHGGAVAEHWIRDYRIAGSNSGRVITLFSYGQAQVVRFVAVWPISSLSTTEETRIAIVSTGAIGTLMAGSGLRNLLEAVYGERAVVHMLSGKAVQRAFRGHLLIDRCLNEMVVSELIQEDSECWALVARSEEEYQSCLASECDLNDGELTETLNMIYHKLCEGRDKIATRFKTSELWFSFVDHGCLLQIQNVEYTYPGRAVVYTIGMQRFRILERSMKDGYHVCSVEWVYDKQVQPEELPELITLHDNLRPEVLNWFENLSENMKNRILVYLGSMPAIEEHFHLLPDGPKWLWWTISILPLSGKIKASLLGIDTLQKRLKVVQQILHVIRTNPLV